jgi:hypothetical protein
MQTLVLWYVMLCSLVFEAVCFLKSRCVQTTRHHTSEASVISIHSNWFVVMEVEIFIVLYLSCLQYWW